MMRRTLTLAFLLSLVSTLPVCAEPLKLFVAPGGSDANTGTAADKPFATLHRARDEIRRIKPADGASVVVAGGTYRLSEPLVLTADDSGSADAPVVYEAAPNQTPIFSGGVAVTGWNLDANGRWVAQLPDVRDGRWNFSQLFVNGQRRFRPRLPKKGYYFIAGETPPTEAAAKHGFDRFQFNPGEIRSNFKDLGDVEALCFSHWFVSRLKIAAVDDAQHIVTFTGSTRMTADFGKLHKGWRYLLENVADALSEPGEWYLDRKTGTLTHIPMPGEDIASGEIVAPRIENLLMLQGDVAGRKWVHHVTFRGLTFEHTNWNVPPDGYSASQAEAPIHGAIQASGARDCRFEHCTVRHTGTYGIDLGAGCRGDVIESCVLSDLGAGGVRIGEPGIPNDAEAIASHNTIRNTLIASGGRVHPAGIGVIVFQSPDNVVQHNEIVDFYYTGISSGWTWGYGKALATGNQYLDNYVHQIGQGVLSDMGGIYTLGNHAGSIVRGNRFEDIESYTYGGWGIYFDEGTTGILAEKNLVIGTKTGGFHQHYGKDNVMRNNVLVDGREQWAERSRVEEHLSFTFERNILIGGQPNVFKGNWKDKVAVDRNVYWCTGGKAPQFHEQGFEQWQKVSGQDGHSVVGDPKLAEVMRGDCAPGDGSAAQQVGFEGFKVTEAGLPASMRAVARERAQTAYPVRENAR
jgi:hypothetical protein